MSDVDHNVDGLMSDAAHNDDGLMSDVDHNDDGLMSDVARDVDGLISDVDHNVDGSVWLAEIARPKRANALRRQTIGELENVVGRAEAQHSTKATTAGDIVSGVIVTGGADRFSAGADLFELNGTIDDLGFDGELERLCQRLVRSPLPIVAAVEGACFGAAVDLAWACDAVVASATARFALPSTSLGILYNPASVARLHARLGSSTLRRLMVLQQEIPGDDLPASSAVVVQPGTAVATAKDLLRSPSAHSEAAAATKALLASLDNEAAFDPAAWQERRESLLASTERRRALEARRTSMNKNR